MSFCFSSFNGRLVRDPEVTMTPSGVEICDFSIAYDTGYGENKKTNFLECIAFKKTALSIEKYFFKGDGIIVEGELQQDRWEDKNTGQKRSKHKLIVNRFHFAVGTFKRDRDAGKEDGGWDSSGTASRSQPNSDGQDDEIPF